jgi:ABC-type histidine transport system ATPase subunit
MAQASVHDIASIQVRVMNKLAVENIHKRYGAAEVLKGVSLAARPGDVISILGSSGSGKSTFLRCINLLEQPNQGAIWLDDQEIKLRQGKHGMLRAENRKALQQLRTKVSMVFQSFNLWSHLNALQNIIEAPVHVKKVPKPEAIANARENLAKVGLSTDVEKKYPAQLSGGQQQRVAIARSLTMDPEVMLFDEPTSALDPELVGEVLKVIQALAIEGRTMIIVTHEINFARHVSNRVVFLSEGKIEEEGPPAEVLERPKSERLVQFLSGTRWHRDT